MKTKYLIAILIASANCMCQAFAQKITDGKIKEILVGNWTSGNGITNFSKEGKFEEYGATYKIKNLIERDPNAKPKVEAHEETSGEWYVTDGILKKRYLVADGKKLSMGKQLFQTCTIESISNEKFQCFYINGNATINWQKMGINEKNRK